MEVRPWSNLQAIQMPAPLHPLPQHPEIWLPKFNLKELYEEDVVVRLFSYTLTGSTGSWYFSLPASSITSWDNFE